MHNQASTVDAHVSSITDRVLNRLPAELNGMIADNMDIPTAVVWRQTCQENYAHVTSSFRRTRNAIVRKFLTSTSAFLAALGEHNCVLGGNSALSFVLRTDDIPVDVLDVYVPSTKYAVFIDRIITDEQFTREITSSSETTFDEDFAHARQVVASTEIVLSNGRTVVIWKSMTCSPCLPIAKATNTVYMNYVNNVAFGCAYPRLTFSRRGIVCNLTREPALTAREVSSSDRLKRLGFSFAYTPFQWPEYSAVRWRPAYPGFYPCFSHVYICPSQERYFGDPGSMTVFTDPLSTHSSDVRRRGQAPYGVMAAWRLVSSFMCSNVTCFAARGILPEYTWAMPVVMVKSAFYLYRRPRRQSPVDQTRADTAVETRAIRSMSV